jgi:hypothetical protein
MSGPKRLGRNPRGRAIILHESVEGAKGRFVDGKGGRATIDAMFAFLGIDNGHTQTFHVGVSCVPHAMKLPH